MFQTNIDEYTKLVEEKLPVYLASLPDPMKPIENYLENMPKDNVCNGMPLEWFDVAAVTALIRNHRDSKDLYEVNSYLVELLGTMFRIAMYKLGWMDDDAASKLVGYLAYDRQVGPIRKDIEYCLLIHDFTRCVRFYPYSVENQVWYSFMMPMLAYTKQSRFNKYHYLARYMVNIINRFSLTANAGEHARDVNVDWLKSMVGLKGLLCLCDKDTTQSDLKYEYYRNVLAEYATVYLACLMQRAAVRPDFGKVAAEIVSYHYVEYSEISQIYFNKQAAREKQT